LRIEVVNFPAFIIIDDKSNDFFKELNLGSGAKSVPTSPATSL